MANQSKFVPPEHHQCVLKHLPIESQFNLRRVNSEFKHMIEDVIWPLEKTLNIPKSMITYNGSSTPKDVWELVLSHMPKLKVVYMKFFKTCASDKLEFCTLLAKYCQGIKRLDGCDNFSEWLVEYVNQLSILGVYDTSCVIYVNEFWNEVWEELDKTDTRSKVLLKIEDYFNENGFDILARYHDKICCIWNGFQIDMPYLPNLEEVGVDQLDAEDMREFASKYHSQITSVVHLRLEYVGNMLRFTNLKRLAINNQWNSLPMEEELKHVVTLERFLESGASPHLTSLQVGLSHDKNAIWLVQMLSSLNRPKKWRQLMVRGYPFSLQYYSRNAFSYENILPTEPMAWITNLFDRIRSPRKIFLHFYDRDMKMQFDNWKQWIEIYASNHRNMQIKVQMKSKFTEEKREIIVEGDNWSISHLQHMYSV